LPYLDHPSQPRASRADPLLAPEPYDAGHNIPGKRLYSLRQTQQLADEFTIELIQLARHAFPNLPPTDRDDLVLDGFISGLRDCAVSSHFTLNPPTNLTNALQLCRWYDSHPIHGFLSVN
uniref:Integrase n=1 Tax=Schistocephalus solidus TaxID=70667 RepID=A0A183TRX4_SCHSO